MSDLLLDKIYSIQRKYLSILKRAESDIFNNDKATGAILDEMYVFWNNNKQIIELFLKNCCSNKDTYFYTAATLIDVDYNEHYPFLTFGKRHIWDDPVYSYRIGLQSHNQELNTMFVEQIRNTIQNDIKILEELNKYIIVLPLRMFCESEIGEYQLFVKEFFLSMFVEKIELENFLEMNDIDKIEKLFKIEARDYIVFEYGEQGGNFAERYNNYITSDRRNYMKNMPAGTVIYMHISSLWMQVLHIIDVSSCYGLIPALAYELSMYYFIELIKNISPKIMEKIYYKSLVAFVLKKRFCYYNINDNLEDYLKTLHDFQFDEMFNSLLKKRLSEGEAMSIRVIAESLDCVYKKMYVR